MVTKRETGKGRSGGSPAGERRRPWPRDVVLAAARAVVDQGLSARQMAPRLGVPYTTVLDWAQKYRQRGESGLVTAGRWRVAKAAAAGARRTEVTRVL